MRIPSLHFVLCAVSILVQQSALAAPLPVANHSFEVPVTAPAAFSGGMASGPSGWTVYNSGATNNQRFFGVWNPSTTNSFVSGAPDGSNVGVVFLENTTGIAEAGLQQTLASTLQLSTQYTLSVEVGDFSDFDPGPFNFTGFPGYRVELFAGNTLLASDINTLAPGEGIFATSTVSFTTAGSHANAGAQLTIRLVNLNGPGIEVNFDNVRLDATAVVCGDNITNGAEVCDLGATAGCTGVGTPFACCTGVGTGACNGAADRCCSGTCTFTGNTCRVASSICDLTEVCTGASQDCPIDDFASAATECRPSAGVCDTAENCTGLDAACPADEVQLASTECRASGGDCDVAENCDGVGTACPSDDFATASAPCGSSSDTACDNPDTCDGFGSCSANNESGATVCRAAVGACDAVETCDGAGACPADATADDGTACNDGNVCTMAETCSSGVCGGGSVSSCDDGNLCTMDSCDEVDGCVNREEPVDPGNCFAPGETLLQIEDGGTPARNSIKWNWKRGEAVDPVDLGTPATTTEYALCVFDHTSGSPNLAGAYAIPAGSLWKTKAGSAKYVDRAGTAHGVQLLKAKANLTAGKSRMDLKIAGANLTLPTPVSADAFFNLDASLTVQLLNSNGACWSTDFTSTQVETNTATSFKAVGP